MLTVTLGENMIVPFKDEQKAGSEVASDLPKVMQLAVAELRIQESTFGANSFNHQTSSVAGLPGTWRGEWNNLSLGADRPGFVLLAPTCVSTDRPWALQASFLICEWERGC